MVDAPGTASAPVPPVGNGSMSSEAELREILEYEKILKLRDEIFAGTHPRLTVPAHAIGKISTRSAPSPSSVSSLPKTDDSIKPRPPQPRSTESAPTVNGSGSQPQSFQTASIPQLPGLGLVSSVSEIDPVLLTKSDDLVKAEIQLQRQRIERALKEQIDQKRAEVRRGAANNEGVPEFDVSNVLERAQEIVKPVTSADLPTKTNATESDSFDENSLYSSQVDTSVEDGAASSESPAEEGQVMEDEPAKPEFSRSRHTGAGLNIHPEPFPQRQPSIQASMLAATGQEGSRNDLGVSRDSLDESDYSPPGAGEIIDIHGNDDFARSQVPIRYPSPQPRGAVQEYEQREEPQFAPIPVSPDSPRVRVRNHISSPAAPQPARVSPLAVAKLPPVLDSRAHDPTHEEYPLPTMSRMSSRQSLAEMAQPINPRKRRRDVTGNDRPRKISGFSRRIAQSPGPYIKEEPVSPPPLSALTAVPSSQRVDHGYRAPRDIEILSPRGFSGDFRGQAVYGPRRADHYEVERPISVASFNPSRGPAPRTIDEPDPRRYATISNARHPPAYRIVYSPPPDSHLSRGPPYTYLERPPIERPLYVRERLPQVIYHAREHTVSPPPIQEAQVYARRASGAMAPPSYRIAIDQQGRKYYTEVATDIRQSVPPLSRYPDGDSYYAAIPSRESLSRVPVRTPRLQDEPTHGQRSSSVLPVSARSLQHADPGVGYDPYRERDSIRHTEMLYPREDVAYIRSHPEDRRQANHFEDMQPSLPREHIVSRMSSVRPDSGRYSAAPPDYVHLSRTQSVRPENGYGPVATQREPMMAHTTREYSVRVDNGGASHPIVDSNTSHPSGPQRRRYVEVPEYLDPRREDRVPRY